MIQVILTAYGAEDMHPSTELGYLLMGQYNSFYGASKEAARIDRGEVALSESLCLQLFQQALTAMGHKAHLKIGIRNQP